MAELQSPQAKVLTKTEIASNTVFGAIEMAQKRGAYSLKESADIYAAIQVLTESVKTPLTDTDVSKAD